MSPEPYFKAQECSQEPSPEHSQEREVQYHVRKCRVNLKRMKPIITKLKRCVVRVARLPDV